MSLLSRRGAPLWALAMAVVFGVAAPAQAAHRARVSADLEDHLTAGSQGIDVIVHGDRASIDKLAARYNLVIKKVLRSGAVLHINAGQLDAMRQDETVDHLSGDTRIKSIADVTAESIGADQVWAGSDDIPALSGEGVTVAVIDSGMDTRHNAFLRRKVLYTKDFTGGDGLDLYGHGTHVASIIAGQRGRLAETSDYRGIASGANLLNLRVLGADGSGMASDVIEAIDWAIEHRKEFKVKVINLSLGTPVLQPYRDDPMCEAVERAVKAGITVVVAAGNFGQAADGRSVYGAITSPANSPHALTVGALDTHGTAQRSDDTLAPYSSKGPTRYDLILKPDLAAPGSRVVAAESASAYLSQTYPERHVAGSGANAYMRLSGTSMAAAVVSGAVALLMEERPSLKPADTKAVLQMTSTFIPSAGLVGVGSGSVNVLSAARWVGDDSPILQTSIGDELTSPSGIIFATGSSTEKVKHSTIHLGATIHWGTSSLADTIYWGTAKANTIYWGTSSLEDTIYWGTSASNDTIYWGTNLDDTIYWGTSAVSAGTLN